MKKVFVMMVICVLFLLSTAAFSENVQVAAKAGTLTVIVEGCKSDQGVVRIALANSIEGYNDPVKAFMSKIVQVSNGKAVHDFIDVPFGEYAVSVYHDENNNNILDKNFLGKPIETCGFSNNARGIMSKPDYNKVVFALDKTNMTVTIHVE